MIPFLNWAGGKRWLVYGNNHIVPPKYNRYIEPFLGSGAVCGANISLNLTN
jgi:DNA adenine methylase